MNRQDDKQRIAQLLSKFMAGETTLNEEQTLTTYFRTHEVDEEWKEYKEMFALFDNGQVDIENRTATAKPKIHFTRWIMTGIAASIILLLGISLLMKDGKTNEKTPDIAQRSIKQSNPQPVPQPVVEVKKEEVLAEVTPTPQPVREPRSVHKTVEQKDTPASTSPADSFDYYLAHLEAEMEALDDSVSTAHLEKLIATDARLQQLVNRIIGKQTEQVMNELRKDSTANYITF